MSEELKPVRCGCGGEARIDAYLGDLRRSNLYYIYCAKCDIRTSNYLSEAEAITAWNKAMGASAEPEPKWIPVTEALPEEDIDVLLQFPHTMGVGYQEDGFWNITTCDDLYSGLDEADAKPIAWMPLPEPYRGE